MNAGAYGRDWSDVLVRALVVTADGDGWLTPDELGLAYRHSALRPDDVVARVEFRLEPRSPERDQGDRRRAGRATEGDPADEQANLRERLQEPARRHRRGEMLELCGLKGHRIGGAADLAQARELHRERRRCDERRLHRADGRGAATRARAVRRGARARGRVRRAASSCRADVGSAGRAANPAAWSGDEPSADRAGVRAAASVVVPFPRGAAGDRLDLARLVPSGRSLLVAFAIVVGGSARLLGRLRVAGLRRRAHRGARCAARVVREVDAATKDVIGHEPRRGRRRRASRARSARFPSVAGVSVDRAFPHTLVVKVAPERPVAVVRRGQLLVARDGIRQGDPRDRDRHRARLSAALARSRRRRSGWRNAPGELRPCDASAAGGHEAKLPRRVKAVRCDRRRADARAAAGPEIRLGEATDVGLKLAIAAAVLRARRRRRAYIDVSVPERPVAGSLLQVSG